MAGFKKLIYSDEVPALSDEDAHDIGVAADPGEATDASRHDHVHALGSEVVATENIDDAAVTVAKMDIDDDISFGKHEIQSVALENLAEAPAEPVSGLIYYNTADKHPYIYQA